MKKISVRRTGSVRLTSAAHPLYGPTCGGGNLPNAPLEV